MINIITLDITNMDMQYNISSRIDMDLYDIIIDNIKKSRTDFLVKILQNQVEQVVKNCYIK